MTDFDAVIDRVGTGSNKWSRYPDDVIPLWVADMDFAVAPEIIDAIRLRLEHPVLGYGSATPELRAAIVERVHSAYGWAIEPEHIVMLPGVEPGFNMALKAMTRPGDGLIVATPVYKPILDAASNWSLTRRDVPFIRADDGWAIDFELFEHQAAQARAFLLCNPQNPTGRVFTRDELERIAEICERHDLFVISDEIHNELLFDGRTHIPFGSMNTDAQRRSVTLMAPSKTYNVAGLKTAFAIVTDASVRERFIASRLGMVDSVNVLGLEAARAAIVHGGVWRDELIEYLQGNRDYLMREIADRLPGIGVIAPEGTFLAWLDCSALRLPVAPAEFFLANAGVALSVGADFGPGQDQWVRLNFGCRRALLAQALDRMVSALS
ncbi:MAG: MalY/PatB family protein [Gordonia sp. (in: high G+C Gram-positive bacteria)]